MWTLFDFTKHGKLLGTLKTFDTEFQKPIVRVSILGTLNGWKIVLYVFVVFIYFSDYFYIILWHCNLPKFQAREKDATEYQQQVGNKIAECLRDLIAPFFLRRTKAEVFKTKSEADVEETRYKYVPSQQIFYWFRVIFTLVVIKLHPISGDVFDDFCRLSIE